MIIRLCYASIRHESSNDLIEDLNSILSTARNFNRKNERIFLAKTMLKQQ